MPKIGRLISDYRRSHIGPKATAFERDFLEERINYILTNNVAVVNIFSDAARRAQFLATKHDFQILSDYTYEGESSTSWDNTVSYRPYYGSYPTSAGPVLLSAFTIDPQPFHDTIEGSYLGPPPPITPDQLPNSWSDFTDADWS